MFDTRSLIACIAALVAATVALLSLFSSLPSPAWPFVLGSLIALFYVLDELFRDS